MTNMAINLIISFVFAGLMLLHMVRSHKKKLEKAEQKYQLTMKILEARRGREKK